MVFIEGRLTPMPQYRLISFNNPKGDISIKNLDLCTYLSHISIFCPCMATMDHILTRVDNTTA